MKSQRRENDEPEGQSFRMEFNWLRSGRQPEEMSIIHWIALLAFWTEFDWLKRSLRREDMCLVRWAILLKRTLRDRLKAPNPPGATGAALQELEQEYEELSGKIVHAPWYGRLTAGERGQLNSVLFGV